MILVDTSVLSLAFRRKRRHLNPDESKVVFALHDLLVKGEVAIIGLIRQELLSGLSSDERFEQIRSQLEVIRDLALSQHIFEQAAYLFNVCIRAGVSPEAIDMTICSAAIDHNCRIFSVDPDFDHYERVLGIERFRA